MERVLALLECGWTQLRTGVSSRYANSGRPARHDIEPRLFRGSDPVGLASEAALQGFSSHRP